MTDEQIEKLLKATDIEFVTKLAMLIGTNPSKKLGDYCKKDILKRVKDYEVIGDWL